MRNITREDVATTVAVVKDVVLELKIAGVGISDVQLVGSARRFVEGSARTPQDIDLAVGVDEDFEHEHVVKRILRRVELPIDFKCLELHFLPVECLQQGWTQFRMVPPTGHRGFVSGCAFFTLGHHIGQGIHVGYTGLLQKKNDSLTVITQDPKNFLEMLAKTTGADLTGTSWKSETLEDLTHSLHNILSRFDVPSKVIDDTFQRQLRRFTTEDNHVI